MKGHEPLTLALPKGRLFEQVRELLASKGLKFDLGDRKLTALDETGTVKLILVRNSDLPTYVHHGIAGLGVAGDDVVYESGHEFTHLMPLAYGGFGMALAARKDHVRDEPPGHLTIATSYTRFTRDYFHGLGIPVKIIRLNGSVELAPVLGLAPYIVDIVETGSTLKANGLEVVETLKTIGVNLFANTAYYKLRYQEIGRLVELLKDPGPGENQ
jgi:ATP phosphoribosyltransferase